MHRRKFIKIGGVTITAVSLFSSPIVTNGLQEKTIPFLLEDFLSAETINLIGKEYLQNNSISDQDVCFNLNNMEIANNVQKDFEEDRTIVVAGWVLSVTEARRCATIQLKNLKNAH